MGIFTAGVNEYVCPSMMMPQFFFFFLYTQVFISSILIPQLDRKFLANEEGEGRHIN